MNRFVEQLCRIAAKDTRLVIGLMSGTSLDGLDVALCRCTGSGPGTGVSIEAFETIPYTDDFRRRVRGVFSVRQVDLEELCLLNAWIAKQHAAMVTRCLGNWGRQPADIDLLASHGQTVYHAPLSLHRRTEYGNATLQLGDGDHLAVNTGIITLSDFRQKHIAAGGEGAPLAVYGDYLVFSREGQDRIMLNIGGIANFTWLPGDLDANSVFSTDTGPGNTLMDALARRHHNLDYDRDAAIARSGHINTALLQALLDHPFFAEPVPKTTGPELFNLDYLAKALRQSGQEQAAIPDIMATLNRFTAVTIADAIRKAIPAGAKPFVFASGGGMHNPLLMQHLEELLPQCSFGTTDSLGVNPDAKEALLFAILANEAIAGNATAGRPAVGMGKISFPG